MPFSPHAVRTALIASLLFGSGAALRADVKLPRILSDHMILQRSGNTPLWGRADPGEKVTVSLAGLKAETTADQAGRWRVALDLEKLGEGPHRVTIAGKNQLRIEDVLIGEVWVCSGQSNMEFPLVRTLGAKEEIARPANPLLRQFLVKKNPALEPAEDCEGQWVAASPSTAGDFTAAGYYFGKKLHETLGVSVGLVNASYGGTPVEAWTSWQSLARDADLRASAEQRIKERKEFPGIKASFLEALAAWEKKNGRADAPEPNPQEYAGAEISRKGWKPIQLPGDLASAGIPEGGAIWLRKAVALPDAKPGADTLVELVPRGFETVYWNGERVGETTPETYQGEGSRRRHTIPGRLLKPGENILAIRLFRPMGGAGLDGPGDRFRAGTVPLPGEWLAKVESALPAPGEEARIEAPVFPKAAARPQDVATALFNGMIHPLIPCGIRGVIWYQGEANAGRAYQYRKSFPLLIEDWRAQWGGKDFPFYFCQLANYTAKASQPAENAWAELREAQAMTLSLPATGQAVLIDIGEADDIHPRNKRDAGERLASIALANTYGKDIPFSGPVYDSMTVEGGKARIRFRHAEGGLVAKPLPAEHVLKSMADKRAPLVRNSPNSELEGFAICGEDRQWVWADAKIEGDTVVVESAQIARPVAVRYAWAGNPTCNLFNGAGFPASPFRTDDFPLRTLDKKY